MEALLFIIDACVLVVVVFFSLKNDTLRAGMRQIGPFRSTEGDPAEQVAARVRQQPRPGGPRQASSRQVGPRQARPL